MHAFSRLLDQSGLAWTKSFVETLLPRFRGVRIALRSIGLISQMNHRYGTMVMRRSLPCRSFMQSLWCDTSNGLSEAGQTGQRRERESRHHLIMLTQHYLTLISARFWKVKGVWTLENHRYLRWSFVSHSFWCSLLLSPVIRVPVSEPVENDL